MIILESFPPLTHEQLSLFEEKHSLKLPSEYRAFLSEHNGGRPKPATFNIIHPSIQNSALQWFGGIHDGQYQNLSRYLMTHRTSIPDDLLPIGVDWGGNYLCIAIKGKNLGRVYFWSHEEQGEIGVGEIPGDRNVYFVSNSFNEFIKSLYDIY